MSNYKLKIWGWEFDGSAHKLTNDEVETLNNFKTEKGYNDLSESGWELEEVIQDWSPHDTNWWVMSKPFFENVTTFILEDNDGNEVWSVKVDELSDIYDLSEEHGIDEDGFDEPTENRDGYPSDGQENILLYYEVNKGIISTFSIESDNEPKPTDFSVVGGSIETPENEIEYIDRVWYKNQELEWDYDDQYVNGKSLEIKLYTLSDVS